MKTKQTHGPTVAQDRSTRALVLRAALATLVVARTLAPAPARADAPASPAVEELSWDARYDLAYEALSAGKLREAASLFHALARTARNDRERVLAHELARLATEAAERGGAEAAPVLLQPSVPVAPPRLIRGADELALLYASGFLFGAGTGVWFLLSTQPDSAITATLPFAALVAAPVIAIATIDGIKPLAPGLPHAISAGLYLGLGESVLLVGRQEARASRVSARYPSSDARFRPETVTGVLWTGATLGATLGGALGAGLETTPGRVSFTASMTIWSGVLTGLTAGALLPDDDRRRERAFTIGSGGYNAGLAGGLLFAGKVSPSVARVRIADLLAVATGLVTTGAYLSIAKDIDVRMAEGIAAGGIGAGLAAGWFVTRGMASGSPASGPAAGGSRASIQPSLVPVPGGAGVGASGVF